MTDFQRGVLQPALREEARAAGAKLRSLLPRKLRKGLADGGRWLQPDAQQQLQSWVAQRPRIRALVEHRARLAAVLEARSQMPPTRCTTCRRGATKPRPAASARCRNSRRG